jgi:hypothetical protein
MPTGYTNGIIEGKVTTFKQFALGCTRAYMVHMRDDSHDTAYYERTTGTYHTEAIQEARDKIIKLKKTSNKQLIDDRREEIKNDRLDSMRRIAEKLETKKTLEAFIKEAEEFVPPKGGKHDNIATFMKDQLTKTIEWDCDVTYYEKEIKDEEEEEKNLDPVVMRADYLKAYNADITYHKKHYDKEVKLCADHNKWYDDFVAALGEDKVEESEEIL